MIDFERTDMSNIISTKEAPVAIGPYSQAKWAGNTLFISGQIPLEPFSMEMVYGVEKQSSERQGYLLVMW